jgi:hypothetical protein
MQRVDLVTHDPYSLGVKEGSLEEETWLIRLRDWGVAGQAGGRQEAGLGRESVSCRQDLKGGKKPLEGL